MDLEIRSFEDFKKALKDKKSYLRFDTAVQIIFCSAFLIPFIFLLFSLLADPHSSRESIRTNIILLFAVLSFCPLGAFGIGIGIESKKKEIRKEIDNLYNEYPEYSSSYLEGYKRISDFIEKYKGVITITATAVIGVAVLFGYKTVNNKMNENLYQKGLNYYFAQDYYLAEECFNKINGNYKDRASYRQLCYLHEISDNVYRNDYLDYIDKIESLSFSNSSEEETFKREEQMEKLKEVYREKDRKQKEYDEKIKNISEGIPFVGMPDTYIDKTSLGKNVRYNREFYDKSDGNKGMRLTFDFGERKYNFTKKRDYTYFTIVFTAVIEDGKVISVTDKRNHPEEISYSMAHYNPTYNDEHYNVNDFTNYEDLYEMYDDFEDLDDAEDYYDRYHLD